MKRKKYLIFMLVFMMLCNAVWTGPSARTVHAEGATTTIIENGDFEKDEIMNEPVVAEGNWKAGAIGDYGWECVPGAVGTTYQIIQDPDDSNNKVLKVAHDPSLTNDAATANGSFRQSYADRYPDGLEDGVKYIVSIRAKAVDAISQSGNESKIQFNLNNSNVGSDLMASSCTDWKDYSFEYVHTSPDSKKYLQIIPYYIAGNGYWLIDDISIEKWQPKEPTITVNPTTLSLEEEETGTLIAMLTDEDSVLGTTPVYEWVSSDTSVATVTGVDAAATVTAVKDGTATITITAKNAEVSKSVSATCSVTVKKAVVNVTGITLNKTALELTVDGEETLTATVAPENATDKTVSWTSSDSSVATVDDNGKVKAVSEGTVTITVKSNANDTITATCSVTVAAKSDTGNGDTSIIVNGDFEKDEVMNNPVVAEGSYKAGAIGNYGWECVPGAVGTTYQIIQDPDDSNNKVLKVTHDPSLTNNAATANGSFRQSYVDRYPDGLEDGVKYIVSIRAKAVDAISPSGSESKIQFNLNNKKVGSDLMASSYTNWKEYSFEYVHTSPDSKKYLQIIPYYIAGNGYWLIDDISIEKWQPKEPTITVNPTTLSLEEEKTYTLTATLTDDDKVLGTTPAYEWESSDTSIATVTGVDAEATVTAVKDGTTTITITAKNADTSKSVSATCSVTVTSKAGTGNEETSIIINGDFQRDDVMDNPVVAEGSYKRGAIGDYGWMCNPSSIGTTYQIIQDPDDRDNNVLKVTHDSTLTNNAAKINGTFIQSYESRYEEGLENGVKYLVSVRAKAVNAINPNDAESKVRLTLNNKTVGSDLMASACKDWTEKTFEYVHTSPDTKKYLQITLYYIAPGGYWLLDDFSIKKAPTISIAPTNTELEVGSEQALVVQQNDPDNALDESKFVWSSANEEVATVDAEGKIKAVGIGETVITLKTEYDNVSAKCSVTVTPRLIVSNGNFKKGTDNWNIASESTEFVFGIVTEGIDSSNALKAGVTGALSTGVQGTINQNLDDKVTDGMLTQGVKYLLTAYAKPVGANSDSAVTVFWYDSETATAVTADATEDNDGWIKFTKEFTAGAVSAAGTKLAVQVSNLKSGYWLFDDISVKRIPYISITPESLQLKIGEKAEINASVEDPDFVLGIQNAFEYSSDNEAVAKVDLRGRVTGVGKGTANITIKSAYSDLSVVCPVTVEEVVLTGISILESTNLCVAEQKQLSVTFTPANATDKNISWTSSDSNVAAVDANGKVTGIKEGTATITATGTGNVTATCTVTVRKSTTLLTKEQRLPVLPIGKW